MPERKKALPTEAAYQGDELQQAINDLRARDEFKRRELDAMLNGMPLVHDYVAQYRESWDERRSAGDTDS